MIKGIEGEILEIAVKEMKRQTLTGLCCYCRGGRVAVQILKPKIIAILIFLNQKLSQLNNKKLRN